MSGAISIPNYSDSNRVPGFYFSASNAQANTGQINRRTLIVAQMVTGGTAKGTATPNTASISAGVVDAQTKYGPRSLAAGMVASYRKIDTFGELWVLPLADDANAIAATGTLVVGGTPTANGVVNLYVGEVYVPVAVTAGMTPTVIAAAIAAACTAVGTLRVTAAANAATVTFTAANEGVCGNDILFNLNLLGTIGGQSTPPGLTLTVTPMANGAVNPTTIATALAALGDLPFDIFAHPYTDTASLNAFQAFLSDIGGRWNPIGQLFGQGISAMRGTLGTVTTFGPTRDDQHHSIMPIADSPSSPASWSGEIAAQCAISMRNNPAIPITGLALTVLPPSQLNHFTFTERNSLLYDGLCTHRFDSSGIVYIERMTTTYQTNSLGNADDSYLDLETMFTLEICIQDMLGFLAAQYPAAILVADGTKIPAGSPVTTAQMVGAACASRYVTQCNNFWCQNPQQFAAGVQAINAGNGEVKLLLPYMIANQLRVVAATVQFTKP